MKDWIYHMNDEENSKEESKIQVRFHYPDQEPVEYSIPEVDATELEIYAITSTPKRLIKRILRICEILLAGGDRSLESVVVSSGSRSGDAYNALKFLEHKGIILVQRDIKQIEIKSESALQALSKKFKKLTGRST